MPGPVSALEVCRSDLFTPEAELRERFPDPVVDRVLRIREMHNWFVANPGASDKEYVAESMKRHGISKVAAYADIKVVKALLPVFATSGRDFHRWRYNEMILQTFKMAEKRKDTKTMERAATSYARSNRVDMEDEQSMPYDQIVPQPFTATDDPRVLGIEPIPNIQEKISRMIEKYRQETIDIDDVEFEEFDLETDTLFPEQKPDDGKENLF